MTPSKDKNTLLLRHRSACFLMQELKEKNRFHPAKSTKDTFPTEVLPVSNGASENVQ